MAKIKIWPKCRTCGKDLVLQNIDLGFCGVRCRDNHGRGTGRTTRMVEQIPADGALIIVHTRAMFDHVRHLIEVTHGTNMLGKCNIAIINSGYDMARLRGQTRKILVDHAFWDQRYPFAAELEHLADYSNSRTT